MEYHNFPEIDSGNFLIFTEGEGDGIESRLPFKVFSTLKENKSMTQVT